MLKKNDSVPGFVVDMPSIQCLQSDWSDRVHSTIALNCLCLHKNWQSTNIYRQNENSTAIRNIIHFIHTSLRDKTAHTTKAATQRKHCVWLVQHPPATVFDWLEIGLTRVKPGTEKNVLENLISPIDYFGIYDMW